MPHHHPHNTYSAGSASTAGLLLSLASEMDRSSALGREARRVAHRLSTGRCSRADTDAGATLLALLLDATDCGLAIDAEGLLDAQFDG